MKKEASECTHILLLLKNNSGKHFKLFDKFTDTADSFSQPLKRLKKLAFSSYSKSINLTE